MGSHGPAAAIWRTAAAAAQAAATVGSLASPLPLTRWVKGDGESVAWAIGQRPVLVQSVPAGRGVPQIDDLTWLQRRWRNGLAVVAIVQGNGAWLEALLARQPRAFHYPIAIDRTETPIVPQHWTGGPPVTMCLLIGSDRRVLWVGDAGEVDAVEAVLAAHDAGRFDLGAAARQAAGERQLRQRFEQGGLDRLLQESGELLGKSPGNGLAWALRALAARRLDRDPSVAAAAPRTLATEPYELLRYARTMQRMLPGAPGGDAAFLFAGARGEGEAALEAALAMVGLDKHNQPQLRRRARLLADERYQQRYVDVAYHALELAIHAAPTDAEAYARKASLLLAHKRDREAAMAVAAQMAQRVADPERLERLAHWWLATTNHEGNLLCARAAALSALATTPNDVSRLRLALAACEAAQDPAAGILRARLAQAEADPSERRR
jgi:hypothetical protein